MTKKLKKKSKSSSKLFIVFAVVALLGFLLYRRFYPSYTPLSINEVSNTTGIINLALTPSTVELEPNATTNVDLNIEAGDSHATGITAELTYDPAMLEVLSVSRGDFFSTSLEEAIWTNGKIAFTYVAPPSSGGKTGSGTVAVISIKYKSGSPKLSFTTGTITTVTEQGTNALHRAQDVLFTLKATTTNPTPLASPEPTASPIATATVAPTVSPTASPTNSSTPSSTTNLSLKNDPTCNSAELKWNTIGGAPGYYVDISKNSGFTYVVTSGKLSGSTGSHLFSALEHGTTYYAHITQAEVSDFPHYGATLEFKTAKDCGSDTTTVTPTAPAVASGEGVAPTKTPVLQALKKLVTKATPTPNPEITNSGTSFDNSTPIVENSQFRVLSTPSSGSLNDVFASPTSSSSPAPKINLIDEFFNWILNLLKFR